MIDYFAIGLTHALLALAFLRLLGRDDLDSETQDPKADKRRGADPVHRAQGQPGAGSERQG